jgi:hypothetical protein
MTNPQLTENLLAVICSLPAALTPGPDDSCGRNAD